MVNVVITGLGSCLPQTEISNDHLTEILDTSDEWITQRSGIETRRISKPEESLPVLATIAAERAIRDANLTAQDIDYIKVGTNSTDQFLVPQIGQRVQYLIGAREISANDVGAGCTGAMYATEDAVRTIRDIWHTENKRRARVLVIGGDVLSNIINWGDRASGKRGDRASAVLLSDGAAAMVLEADSGGGSRDIGIKHIFNRADGAQGYLIHYESGLGNRLVSREPLTFEQKKEAGSFQMIGRSVHEFILKKSSDSIRELLEGSGLTLKDLTRTTIIPHQMNLRSINKFTRILESFKRGIGYRPKKVYTDGIINYGNNSTASVLLGFDEMHRAGKLEYGEPVMGVAFGAGLTWGGFLTIWNRQKPEKNVIYDMDAQWNRVMELNEKYNSWLERLA